LTECNSFHARGAARVARDPVRPPILVHNDPASRV
jgi:hypothetical protein